MENKELDCREYPFGGMCLPGFGALAIGVLLIIVAIWLFSMTDGWPVVLGILAVVVSIFMFCGLAMLEPNESYVMLFFGKYRGTLRRTGFFAVNPFYTKRKMSLRINNLDIAPIKVNDSTGNPVMIGMVLVWKVDDTYRATFDVESMGLSRSVALRNFVNIQGDAALREVAGHYAYDNEDAASQDEITLRSGGQAINDLLEQKINERLAIAGINVVEARINYLAYAPEIAAVMLKRQQASAIISAREKIVDGAVTMVEMALERLDKRQIVALTGEQRASIVGNLLMVLCSDESAQPVIPAD